MAGPVSCSEAKTVLSAYYANVSNGVGVDYHLQVGRWLCAAYPQAPVKKGECRDTGRDLRFEMIDVEPAPKPPSPPAPPADEGFTIPNPTTNDYRQPLSVWPSYSDETKAELAGIFLTNNPNDCAALSQIEDGVRCDKRDKLHAHHLIPLVGGGSNSPSNGVALCRWHHKRVEREAAAF